MDKIVFSLKENLYTDGLPVIIKSGDLIKNSETNRISLRLNFKNISGKIIECLKVEITLHDTANRELCKKITYDYLDLNAKNHDIFGSRTLIEVDEFKARSFIVEIKEVIFQDKTVLDVVASTLKEIEKSEYLINDLEVDETKYLAEICKCIYLPQKNETLWICTCGEINGINETTCYNCNILLESLNNQKSFWEEKCNKHLMLFRQQKEEKREKIKSVIKKAKIITFIVAAVFAIIISLVINHNILSERVTYENEEMMLKDIQGTWITKDDYHQNITIYNNAIVIKDGEFYVYNCCDLEGNLVTSKVSLKPSRGCFKMSGDKYVLEKSNTGDILCIKNESNDDIYNIGNVSDLPRSYKNNDKKRAIEEATYYSYKLDNQSNISSVDVSEIVFTSGDTFYVSSTIRYKNFNYNSGYIEVRKKNDEFRAIGFITEYSG